MDSKFILTLKYLITKPGFLTDEIIASRRNLYIKPFLLYVMFVCIHYRAVLQGNLSALWKILHRTSLFCFTSYEFWLYPQYPATAKLI